MSKSPKKSVKAEKATSPASRGPKGTKEQEKTYSENWEDIDFALKNCLKHIKTMDKDVADETIRRLGRYYQDYLVDNHDGTGAIVI